LTAICGQATIDGFRFSGRPVQTQKSRTIYFALEGLNTLATSYFNGYLYFLLRDRFGFGNLGNLSAAALGGFVYVFAAWQGGRFAQRFGYFTALKTGFGGLAACMAIGAFCPFLPAVFLVIAGWSAAVCFVWPTLEALVSDGVCAGVLPKNIGIYNIVWSAGMAAMYFFGGTLYETLGHASIFWLPALVHGGQFLIVLRLGKNPVPMVTSAPPAAATPSPDMGAAEQPVSPRSFLHMVWLAIPFSYIGITTVMAVIPALATTLGLSTAQAGLFCSIWMFARLGTFAALWQWTGWHYRFRWLLAAFVGLTAGFSLLLLSHNLGLLVAAQAVFGVSVGLIYYSSLFYSMDVGQSKGEHGGLHEAMIGSGICLGPAVGALSLCLAPGVPNAGAVTVTALLACGLAGLIGLRLR
jgi:predicted MFS family arabinose efflux permease